MAKFDWGFDILNKDTAHVDGMVQIACTRTGTMADFALGNHKTASWGDKIYSCMPANREMDAVCALETWGWM